MENVLGAGSEHGDSQIEEHQTENGENEVVREQYASNILTTLICT